MHIDELHFGERVLILEGPPGLFSPQLAHWLQQHQRTVFKLHTHPLDKRLYPQASILHFQDSADKWPAFCEAILHAHRIDTLVLYDDFLPAHDSALAIARERGINTVIFNRGYLDDGHLAVETGGSHVRSGLMKKSSTLSQLLHPARLDEQQSSPTSTTRPTQWQLHILLLCADKLLRLWQRHLWRAASLRWTDDADSWWRNTPVLQPLTWLLDRWRLYSVQRQGPVFLLFVSDGEHSDAVARRGDCRLESWLSRLFDSFSRYAPASARLLIAPEPLTGDINRHYQAMLIHRLSRHHGLSSRLRFVPDTQQLQRLLGHCTGVLSTHTRIGLETLRRGTPLHVPGQGICQLYGLADRQNADKFWAHPTAPNNLRVQQFLRLLERQYSLQGEIQDGSVFCPVTTEPAIKPQTLELQDMKPVLGRHGKG